MNNRSIDLSPHRQVSITQRIDNHTMVDVVTIILEMSGDCWYIQDDIEKIMDISHMPSYIKDDWLLYNRREIDLNIINKHIVEYTSRVNLCKNKNIELYDMLSEGLKELISIRRDLLIKKII